jgi:hypothetical protein
MDKDNPLKDVKARLSEKEKSFKCLLMLADKNLDKEPLLKELLQVDGAELEFIEKTGNFRFVVESKPESYGYSVNDHIRSLALKCSNKTDLIRIMIERGVFGSVTYLGVYENGDAIAEIIDPDVSKFLSDCKLPLHIHYGQKA